MPKSDFQSQFSISKIIRNFFIFFSLKNTNLGAQFLLLTFFKSLYFLKWCPILQFSKFNNYLWVCWFLGKNISNFVSPDLKLHNLYCHKCKVVNTIVLQWAVHIWADPESYLIVFIWLASKYISAKIDKNVEFLISCACLFSFI